MQRVRLLGELGELFGAEHEYQRLRHPGDAIKMLCINKPAFKDYLLTAHENGIGFKVIQAGAEMGYDEILLPLGQNDLIIAPVISGSGGTVTKILVGVGLVALSFVSFGAGGLFAGSVGVTGAGALATGAIAAGSTAALGSIGLLAVGSALVLSGVSDIISPQPKLPSNFGSFGAAAGSRFGSRNSTGGPVGVERALGGQQSYAYTGAANTVGVGATVPVAYGKVLIGSHLLRSKLEVTDESDPIQKFIKNPDFDTILLGGEKLEFTFGDKSGVEAKRIQNKTAYKSGNGGASFVNNANVKIKIQDDAVTGVAYVDKKTGASNKTNFNVILQITGGLYDIPGSSLGGINPTKVDAFVSYELKVYRGTQANDNKLIAMDSATIQGLLVSGQDYAWVHKMTIPTAQSEANVAVDLKIVNTSSITYDQAIGKNQELTIRAIGYNLF